jgi:polysaccharide export outer membrane protein
LEIKSHSCRSLNLFFRRGSDAHNSLNFSRKASEMPILVLSVLLLLSAGLSTAQETVPSGASAPTAAGVSGNRNPARNSYRLGSGDQILIRAANVPDISEKPIRVDLNGNINMPMIGRIQAGGLTVDQLESEITTRLKVYLEQPDVAVSVAEYQSQPVSVFGEVVSPGVHQLQGRKSLVEILAMTGGVKADAGPSIRITRQLAYGRIPLPGAKDDLTGKFSIAELQLKPLIQAKTPENDIDIEPYDIISVPKAELVYIGGDVSKASVLPLNDSATISIMEALASIGGVTKTADTKKARIMRNVAGTSKRSEVPVDISRIMSGKAEDVQLVAGDILFIPSSASKKATLRALEAAIQLGTVILSSGVVNGTI